MRYFRFMPGKLLLAAALCLAQTRLSLAATRFRLSGGISAANIKNGGSEGLAGGYIQFQARMSRHIFGRAHLSGLENDDIEVTRGGLSAGYVWRPNKIFRPFASLGVSGFDVKEVDASDRLLLDGRVSGLTAGGGFECGGQAHALFVDYTVGPSGRLDGLGIFSGRKFNVLYAELQLGYMYRFGQITKTQGLDRRSP